MSVQSTLQPVSSTFGQNRVQKKRKLFLFLVFCLSIAVLVGLLLVFKENKLLRRESKQTDVIAGFIVDFQSKSSSLVYPGYPLQKRYIENFERARNEQDSRKRFELLATNFDFLRRVYISSRDGNVRKLVWEFRDFLQKNFSTEFSNDSARFDIECLDETCREIAYPAQVQEIIDLINSSSFKDENVKRDVLNRIEDAQLASADEQKFSLYSQAYQFIKAEVKISGNQELKKAEEKLLALIKQIYGKS